VALFIFSNEKYLEYLLQQHQVTKEIGSTLFRRLGVQSKPLKRVTMLVISKDTFNGLDILFDLAIQCEKVYKKKIDLSKMRVVVFSSIDTASKSPLLEQINFIFIPEENLQGVKDYPELEHILPFQT
jgi:hypothetical protein